MENTTGTENATTEEVPNTVLQNPPGFANVYDVVGVKITELHSTVYGENF